MAFISKLRKFVLFRSGTFPGFALFDLNIMIVVPEAEDPKKNSACQELMILAVTPYALFVNFVIFILW